MKSLCDGITRRIAIRFSDVQKNYPRKFWLKNIHLLRCRMINQDTPHVTFTICSGSLDFLTTAQSIDTCKLIEPT